MILHINPADPTPVYEQIRAQITDMVAAGTLEAGTRLPTIRQLANDLGVANGTVARAYETLNRDGVVEAGGRRGTTVAERTPPQGEPIDERLARAARHYAVTARQLGVDRPTAVAAVREELGELDI